VNLTKLFEMQDVLDERIVKEKGLERQDLLPEKILALQVELGEMANEWRGFKFWSNNQEPNVLESKCIYCHTLYVGKVEYCEGCYEEYEKYSPVTVNNPLLEEYVDCLHFILSIGNELGDYDYNASSEFQDIANITDFLSFIFEAIPSVKNSIKHKDLTAHGRTVAINNYEVFIGMFLKLGDKLGFTWEQIEQAYYDKNKINHERQSSNY